MLPRRAANPDDCANDRAKQDANQHPEDDDISGIAFERRGRGDAGVATSLGDDDSDDAALRPTTNLS